MTIFSLKENTSHCKLNVNQFSDNRASILPIGCDATIRHRGVKSREAKGPSKSLPLLPLREVPRLSRGSVIGENRSI